MPRYTAASKVGNGVISLPWQLRCHCNPDHNKVSSLSNTTVVLIFPNLCLWRHSLRSNVGGIHPKKLYRATLTPTTDEHRGGYWRKQRPWTIVKEQFPVPRNKAASKIGNGVISLQWQLRCRCNTDHDKFSSLSDTAVVVISKSVNGDVVYVQTWGALIPKNSHRATLIWNCIPLSIKNLIKIRLKLN